MIASVPPGSKPAAHNVQYSVLMRLRCVILSTLATFMMCAQEATFRSDSRLVVLNVSVFDQQGKVIKDLGKDAFTVYENGAKQNVTVFRQEDVPISLGLIIDNSASMTDKKDRVASAALAMVKASNSDDEVFIINFNEHVSLAKEFTNDIKDLENALRHLDSNGETAMRDALHLGIEHLRHRGKRDKKVVLVVTDGEDNSSVETQAHLVEVAQQNDVIIYAIGLLGAEEPESAARAKKQLDELTQQTGGRAWFPNDVAEIANITPQIAHEIRNQYVLAYTPTNLAADGSYRKIRVEVDVPGALVRTRSGYYAPR
jgi:Ca-activated chloride channel family protein